MSLVGRGENPDEERTERGHSAIDGADASVAEARTNLLAMEHSAGVLLDGAVG